MLLRCPLQLSSIRDLLAVITSFSLLSVYLTYHLGFSAGRLHNTDGSVAYSRLESLSYRDRHDDSPFHSPLLLDMLSKLESYQVSERQPLAVFKGHRALLQRAVGLYSRILRNHGFSVRVEDTSMPNISKTEHLTNWTLLLCFAFSDGEPECFSRTGFRTMRPQQRVNRIVGVQRVLWRRSGLCRTASQLSSLPALMYRPIAPTCFALPDQYEEFLNTADGPGFNNSWLLKPSVPEGKLEHLSTMQFFNRVRLKEFSENQELIVQQFLPNQLHVLGVPVSVQLFVLVSSVAPLRAYLYGEGFVHFRQGEENNFRKIPGKWWLVSQLWRHVAATQGSSTVKMALDNTDMLLVHLLLGAEAFLLVEIASLPTAKETDSRSGEHVHYRCENCFQLLAVEIMYNSSFYPVVLGVSGQPSLGVDSLNNSAPSAPLTAESTSSRTRDIVRQSLFSDTMKLLFATDSVHRSVFDSLQVAAEALNTGVTGLQCLISHDLCLTEDDLASLLASRREMLNTGNFRRLYPTPSGSRYSGYLQELQALMLQDTNNVFQRVNSLFRETLRHSTSDLHGIQTRLEHIHSARHGSADVSETFPNPETEPEAEEEYSYASGSRLQPTFNLQSAQSQNVVEKRDNCSQDEALSSYLKSLDLQPSVALDPPFTPLWTEYRAHVSYDVTMVRVIATPLHCNVQTRFEHRLGPTQ
ncbi:cadherin-like and PC-esterase domain-containing protein 1 [Zootermopsis nevadensis]|uniref:cadherin-like and PC-esterase domain-containing protein 1 n=1 Tax=Zootermopsis nevadensis TaxID=136037 RepID=UPI000B8EC27D|nr:cadherin-like and PC-esterase domain-containing protein 1 [Zootermopsis nevadensis]